MNPLFVAAAEIGDFCEGRDWGFCFIGGLAVLRWGEPRLTRDVDLTILAPYGVEAPVVDELLTRFAPRMADARAFALENRVLLVAASNDVPIDIALGGLAFEARAVERASPWSVGGASLMTCGVEDLLVHKVFAGRDRDWLDVEGIVSRRGGRIDRDLVSQELAPLLDLKGSSADLQRLLSLLDAAS